MSKLNRLNFIFLLVGMIILNACKKSDPTPVNQEEEITTLKITFTPLTGGGSAQTFTWKDTDGSGGNAPTIDNIVLTNTKNYSVSIQVLNEANPSAIEDITEEIKDEKEAHQFFFKSSANLGSKLSFTYNDVDTNNKPVGLVTTATVGAVTSGSGNSLTITLRHEPSKNASGVSTGDITNAGGETDIEVTFPVTIN